MPDAGQAHWLDSYGTCQVDKLSSYMLGTIAKKLHVKNS
jgi:hypothetical protein